MKYPFDFIPPHLFGASSNRNNVNNPIEDVQFEGIKSQSRAKPHAYSEYRIRQIEDAAMDEYKDFPDSNPMCKLMMVGLFILGAKWVDENPVSNFRNEVDWLGAQKNHIANELQPDPTKESGSPSLTRLLIYTLFGTGADWARKHPIQNQF